MELLNFPLKRNINILALGAESAGVFAVYYKDGIFVSENFGDLLDESIFLKYKKSVLEHLKKEKIKPDVILTDLHPLFKTTFFGAELAKKYKISRIKIQHHTAHIFSSVGDSLLQTKDCRLKTSFHGIAMDGTGYGLDGKIWGGEIIQITNYKLQITNKIQKANIKDLNFEIERIGSTEEQVMIGGDLAVREPARMLIAILAKITNYKLQITNKIQITNSKTHKDFIYKYIKKYYSRNEFEALYNQLRQDFNCQKTTSTGRILDAVAVLLGFAGNERNYKHEATKKLEENSGKPFLLEPKIILSVVASESPAGDERGNPVDGAINTRLLRRSASRNDSSVDSRWILQTTPLFKYLIKNINKDRKRLAATAQLYIAKGLCKIIKIHDSKFMIQNSCIFAAGGMANNRIISEYLEKKSVYLSKKIPRGDEGIAFGQIVYYLTNSRH